MGSANAKLPALSYRQSEVVCVEFYGNWYEGSHRSAKKIDGIVEVHNIQNCTASALS